MTPERWTTSTRCSRRNGDWVPLGGADEQKAARRGHRRGLGSLDRQPARWLVRAQEGSARPVRGVHAAVARGARPGGSDARSEEQPHAGRLRRGSPLTRAAARVARRRSIRGAGRPNRRAIVELLGFRRPVRTGARGRTAHQPACSLAPPAVAQAGRPRPVEEPSGTRRIYRLHDEEIEAVRAYLEQVWGEAAARFSVLVASNTSAVTRTPARMIEPIRLRFELACPADTHSRSGPGGSPSGGPPTTPPRARRTPRSCWSRAPAAGSSSGPRPGPSTSGVRSRSGSHRPRLRYLWHLRRDRADATEVEVRYLDRGDATTTVEIEHRGWEALGAEGEAWRDRNQGGWATLLPHFVRLAEADAEQPQTGIAGAPDPRRP